MESSTTKYLKRFHTSTLLDTDLKTIKLIIRKCQISSKISTERENDKKKSSIVHLKSNQKEVLEIKKEIKPFKNN